MGGRKLRLVGGVGWGKAKKKKKKKERKKENRVKQGNTEKSPKSRLNHDLFYCSSVKLMNFCVYSLKVILKSSPRIVSTCGRNDSDGVVLHFEECSSWTG